MLPFRELVQPVQLILVQPVSFVDSINNRVCLRQCDDMFINKNKEFFAFILRVRVHKI